MSHWVISSESRQISGDTHPTCHTSQRKSKIQVTGEKQKKEVFKLKQILSQSEILLCETETTPALEMFFGPLGAGGQRVRRQGRVTSHTATMCQCPVCPFMHLLFTLNMWHIFQVFQKLTACGLHSCYENSASHQNHIAILKQMTLEM